MKNFAHLKKDSPFYPLFKNGFVPIRQILLPVQAECLGDGIQDVYMVDVPKLSPQQLEKILDMITAKYPGQRDEAKADIMAKGLPLRAKHVSGTSSDVHFFL